MFIDVTKFGGLRIIRLAVTAIAYIDATDGGAAVRLIGGESLRVNEEPSEIEARVMATLGLALPSTTESILPTPVRSPPPAKEAFQRRSNQKGKAVQ